MPIADVVAYYAERSGDVARPKDLAARLDRLLTWWGGRMLADISGHTCEEYETHRGSASSARRELEDLQTAIALYARNGLCRERVVVTLPKKSEAREAHFTRGDIARLVWFCLTYRTSQRGRKTKHRSLRHIVPFILTAVYTGSRSARVWNASYEREPGRPWLDLENGIYYRIGEEETRYGNKRADPIPIPDRLLHHMRRWQRGRLVVDKATGRRVRRSTNYVVEWLGKPADPKKGLMFVMNEVFGKGHGFVRHSFRHTCATWLLWEGGHTEEEIAAYLSMTVQILRRGLRASAPGSAPEDRGKLLEGDGRTAAAEPSRKPLRPWGREGKLEGFRRGLGGSLEGEAFPLRRKVQFPCSGSNWKPYDAEA